MLDAMFHKEGLLISRGQQAIVEAPGANANPQRFVENESAPASPYIVTSKSSKRGTFNYECSANCSPFAAYGLCSHVLAIEELDNKLEESPESRVQSPESRVRGPGSGSGVQGPGSGVRGPGSGVRGPGTGIRGPGSRVQGPVQGPVQILYFAGR